MTFASGGPKKTDTLTYREGIFAAGQGARSVP